MGKSKPFTILEPLLRLLHFVMLIIRMLDRQAPDVEVIADRRDNVVLVQFLLARYELPACQFNRYNHFYILRSVHGEIERLTTKLP